MRVLALTFLYLLVFPSAILVAVGQVVSWRRRRREHPSRNERRTLRPLRSTLFGAIFIWMLVPFLLAAVWLAHEANRAQRDESQVGRQLADLRDVGIVVHDGAKGDREIRLPASEFGRVLGVAHALTTSSSLREGMSGIDSLDHLEGALAGTGVPSSALASLRRSGYAYGSTVFHGQRATYAAWLSFQPLANGPGGGNAQLNWVLSFPRAWWHRVVSDALQLPMSAIVAYLILAPFAALTAWYLHRRIAKPVEQVAAASVSLADGERPEPVPVTGPSELATMARSFNRMSEKLKQAEAAEQQFLMSVSHELKTPLTSIRGYAEGLVDGALPADEASSVIAAEADRLDRLVQDVLDLGRARTSSFSARREAIDLAAIAREAVRRYEGRAAEFEVTLVAASEGAAPAVGDADRVLQVVSNLVENALRCSPAGGTVTISTEPGVLRVADPGPGLDAEAQEHAFERFYLYERYGKDRAVGTGLGLAIVKELAEAMGGSVEAGGVIGAGAEFTLRLPE